MKVNYLINGINKGAEILNAIECIINNFNKVGNAYKANDNVQNRKNDIKNNIKNKGLECKLYNLLKNSEADIQNYELKEEKKKVNPLQIAAMSFIPGYVYFKVANVAYNKIIEVKDKQEKHNVFNDLFQESGLQEKMQNDVYYRPSIVELNNFKEEYKLRANVELIQMLAQYHG